MKSVGLAAAGPLIPVHTLAPWPEFLDRVPRSRLLSFSGDGSIAFYSRLDNVRAGAIEELAMVLPPQGGLP